MPGLVIGSSLARALKLRRGDRLQLITGDFRTDSRGNSEFKPNNLGFELLGCFDSGRDDYDMTYVYLSRPDFERLKWGDSPEPRPDCRSVQVRIADSSKVAEVKEALSQRHPSLIIGTWEEKNGFIAHD